MRKSICILDYGVGNIFSLKSSLERIGYKVDVSNSKSELEHHKIIFLPGVGSFPFAMNNLKKNGLDFFLKEQLGKKDKTIIGICLGMQILFEFSEEGSQKGLEIIPGKVVKFDNDECHVGWNIVESSDDSILSQRAGFYFNHSYKADCEDKYVYGYSHYQKKFPVIVNSQNFYGLQFHPEKSQNAGMHILNNLIRE